MTAKTTPFDDLKKLRDHLHALDSGSGDANTLAWAVAEIDRLREELDGAENAMMAMSDSLGVLANE